MTHGKDHLIVIGRKLNSLTDLGGITEAKSSTIVISMCRISCNHASLINTCFKLTLLQNMGDTEFFFLLVPHVNWSEIFLSARDYRDCVFKKIRGGQSKKTPCTRQAFWNWFYFAMPPILNVL